ncbi:MAG: hypothetical protein ACLSE8_07915 [Parasutterella sp.]
MMNRRTFLAAAVSAAMLTGCAVGPDYNRHLCSGSKGLPTRSR